MATDATGTPTSPDSIPKYDVTADKPSGLGFNAAMDAIQTAFNNHVDKPGSIASGEVPVWNGSAWVRSSVTNIGLTSMGSGTPAAGKYLDGTGAWTTLPTSGPTWTYASTPPGSPTTGDIWVYRDADPDSTFTWMFRFNSGNTTYDWEFVGGSPQYKQVTGTATHANTAYGDWSSGDTTLTIPRAGVYEIGFVVAVSYGSGNGWSRQAISVNAGAPADLEEMIHIPDGTNSMGGGRWIRTFSASDTIKLQEKSQFGNTLTAEHREIWAKPIRVS